MHVHVESGDQYAKFWIDPVRLSGSTGYNASELNELGRLVGKNEALIRGKWDEYFGR